MTYGFDPDGAFTVTPADVAARIQQHDQRRAEENLAWEHLAAERARKRLGLAGA